MKYMKVFAFIFIFFFSSHLTGYAAGTSIMGDSKVDAKRLHQFAQIYNDRIPKKLADYYIEIGEIYNLRGDIAYLQMIKETGFYTFGGSVRKQQNNFAGLGAVNAESSGATFENIEEGVRAHIQHLYAYASTNALPNQEQLVDDRFGLVQRGSVKTWEELNGKWASPGKYYGQEILLLYNKMLAVRI